jgi:protein-tyrosine phosphatase
MIWAPLTIFQTPGIQWTISMIKLINNLIDSRQTVLLHDTLGIQRLGFVITAFYMQRFGLKRDQALAAVRRQKPDIDPPPNYMNLLSQFETYL